eukprot:TRINITY_DN27965_c0_g1_i1.p1 TRINITY_DN27965_c0_g1~~TRINITY_DN27965_c0_g1_i1.p1  ORF type:complete len:135 (-),score=0.07 TRINITY_DN27965_c0_g1_i1:120-524(-)
MVDSKWRAAMYLKGPPAHEGPRCLVHAVEKHHPKAAFDPTYERERFMILRRLGFTATSHSSRGIAAQVRGAATLPGPLGEGFRSRRRPDGLCHYNYNSMTQIKSREKVTEALSVYRQGPRVKESSHRTSLAHSK